MSKPDKVLLKLRRHYSKDEAFKYLFEQKRAVDTENRSLARENAHFRAEIDEYDKDLAAALKELEKVKSNYQDLAKKYSAALSQHPDRKRLRVLENKNRALMQQLIAIGNRHNEKIHLVFDENGKLKRTDE